MHSFGGTMATRLPVACPRFGVFLGLTFFRCREAEGLILLVPTTRPTTDTLMCCYRYKQVPSSHPSVGSINYTDRQTRRCTTPMGSFPRSDNLSGILGVERFFGGVDYITTQVGQELSSAATSRPVGEPPSALFQGRPRFPLPLVRSARTINV